jgi:tetratricopeptide (TPR) repeat protein
VRERFGMAGYPAFEARALLALTLAEVGEFAEGVAYGEEAVRIAEALDHPFSLALARNQLGSVHVTRGDLEQAASWLERGLDLCRSWDLPNLSVWAYSGLGITYARAGRADGLALLEQAVEIATSRELMTSAALRAAWLGEAHLLAGSARDALRQARHALALATEYNERGSQIHARWLLAEIAAQCEPPDADEAEALYREALALAEELGMRPLQAHCHLGLGKLHRRVGRREEARAELVTAVTMLREMGMAFWLPEAEAELAQSNASTLVEPAG